MTILSVPLKKLTDIDAEITEGFLQTLLKDVPQLGKEAERYFIINNHLNVFNPNNLKFLYVFNLFLEVSRSKYNCIQFTKS